MTTKPQLVGADSKADTESQLRAIFAESLAGRAQFAGADPDSVQRHLAVEDAIAAAWTGRGEKIDYATGLRRAAEKIDMAAHPFVDPDSQRLHLAAEAEVEAAWRSRGERITYLDALRLAAARKGEKS